MSGRPSARSRRAFTALFGSRTDIGCVREHNEDSLVVAPPLFAVADGMGGHAAGEVASEIAVRSLAHDAPHEADTEALGTAVVTANHAVIEAARQKGRSGMGTTLTAAVLDGERLALAQVGDSRAYLLHNGRLQQLTRDHSLMADMIEAGELTAEEARVHPQRSVITRALGSDPGMQPDLYEINVAAHDRLLLCSDGLTTMLEDKQIERILNRTHDPQRCASILVNEAIGAGGYDNVTVVVVDIEGNASARVRKARRRGRLWGVFIVAALIATILGVCFGVYSYAQGTAYLTAQDGKVAVYAGAPGTVLGHELSHLDHVTDISVDDLQPGVAARLKDGVIRTDSLDAANKLVDEYQSDIASSSKSSTSSSNTQSETEAEKEALSEREVLSSAAQNATNTNGSTAADSDASPSSAEASTEVSTSASATSVSFTGSSPNNSQASHAHSTQQQGGAAL